MCVQCVPICMIGRGGSGYRGIGYDKKRKNAPWRIKVGRKTVGRFAKLEDACIHVADHAHLWYGDPDGHGYKRPNQPTTDPDQPRVGRTLTRSASTTTNDPSVATNDEDQSVPVSTTGGNAVPTTDPAPAEDPQEAIVSVPKEQDDALMQEILVIADDADHQTHKV